MSKRIEEIYNNITPERKRRFEYANQIAEQLHHQLKKKEMTPRKLAEKMNMKLSRLKQYMNGEANLNLETIAGMEIALDERILHFNRTKSSPKDRSISES